MTFWDFSVISCSIFLSPYFEWWCEAVVVINSSSSVYITTWFLRVCVCVWVCVCVFSSNLWTFKALCTVHLKYSLAWIYLVCSGLAVKLTVYGFASVPSFDVFSQLLRSLSLYKYWWPTTISEKCSCYVFVCLFIFHFTSSSWICTITCENKAFYNNVLRFWSVFFMTFCWLVSYISSCLSY